MKIKFSKPDWGKREEAAAVRAMREWIGTGDGPNTLKLEKMMAKITGAEYALATTSCTHALELAVAGLGLKAGDEVIMPSFTMTSTANAVALKGATPVFADIDRRTFNINPRDIRRKISGRTVGIIVVHYAGMACEMEKIGKIARENGLWVVEDAAHAIGALYRGKALGTWGDAGCFSFHGTKNIACGEGGALVTNRKELYERMEVYRANGTNRKAFLEGTVDKYSWVSPGTSFFLSDILAAVANSQLAKLKTITAKRKEIAEKYLQALSESGKGLMTLPVVPAGTDPNWHIFALKFRDMGTRRCFQAEMRKKGIETPTHYVPLHSSRMGREICPHQCALPVTDDTAATLVRLPIYPGLSKREISYILKSTVESLHKSLSCP